MKTARICLLLLLAVLLPVRGAVAAAMLCPPAGVGMNEPRMGHHGPGAHAMAHHGDMAVPHAADGTAQHDDGPSLDGDEDTSSVQDKCTLCAAFCSFTPLVNSASGIVMPHVLAAAAFPPLSAPAPSFLSDGQERPPRSL